MYTVVFLNMYLIETIERCKLLYFCSFSFILDDASDAGNEFLM